MLADLGLGRYGVTTGSQRQYLYLQSLEDRLGVSLKKKYHTSLTEGRVDSWDVDNLSPEYTTDALQNFQGIALSLADVLIDCA